MNAFLEFIKDLLTLRTTWIDKGQGRWVARRRMHPLMRLIVFCGAATAVTVLGVELLRSGPVPAPEAAPCTGSASSTPTTCPDKIERDLVRLFPRQSWGDINHYLIGGDVPRR